jgi:hypothetical protein
VITSDAGGIIPELAGILRRLSWADTSWSNAWLWAFADDAAFACRLRAEVIGREQEPLAAAAGLE